MDKSASESSSDGESGWTVYLCHSTSVPPLQHDYQTSANKMSLGHCGARGEEGLSMSMVSDASSGPPMYPQQCFSGNGSHHCCSDLTQQQQQHEEHCPESCMKQKSHSCLDDTATSPLLSSPHPPMEHASSQFKGTAASPKHFGLLKSQKPVSEDFGQ